jgi:uncharacterized protein YdaT
MSPTKKNSQSKTNSSTLKPTPEKDTKKTVEKKQAKPAAIPVAKPTVKPVAKTAVKPAAKPTAKPTAKPVEKTASKPEVVVKKTKEEEIQENQTVIQKEVSHNYQITLRASDKKWQVKNASSSKVLKLFDTQEEAIQYASQLAENQDGNITIHKVNGKIRKQTY